MSTSNQTKKLSQVRDVVEVNEVPIFNVEIRVLTNKRTIDANKLGISSDALSSLPEHIQTKLAQTLVPDRATRPLLSIRKAVQDFMKRSMVEQKPFGYVCGHEVAEKNEEFLLKKQDEFYASIMDENDYNEASKKIINDLRNDPMLKGLHWHDRFIELSEMRQPTWETYIESCEFIPKAHFIGAAGTASTLKLRTASETFSEICSGTKAALVDEISNVARDILTNIAKQKQDHLIQEKTWKRMFELADKLSSLSFVSPNIVAVETELREMLLSFLPNAGSITGQAKSNFVTILSTLVDPFALADKIDNQQPLFKEVTLRGVVENLDIEQQIESSSDLDIESDIAVETETEAEAEAEVEVEAEVEEEAMTLVAAEEDIFEEEITLLPVIEAVEVLVSEDEFNQLDPNTEFETSADEFINEFTDMDQTQVVDINDSDDILSALGF